MMFGRKEMIFVGTALVAVRLKVRTGTSPVPTKSNPSITTFSTVPLACENVMLNFNELRPYGRLQLQNLIMTQSLWGGGWSEGGQVSIQKEILLYFGLIFK